MKTVSITICDSEMGGEERRSALSTDVLHIRGEAWEGPGRESDRCICIMAPSGLGLAAVSSFPASRCQYKQTTAKGGVWGW